jgi:hypothetical protein
VKVASPTFLWPEVMTEALTRAAVYGERVECFLIDFVNKVRQGNEEDI